MPSEHRIVEIAAGTKLRLRLGRQDVVAPGKVRLHNSRRGDLVVDQRCWNEGVPA